VYRVNRNQALSDVRTLEQILVESMMGNRVVGTLLTAFAGLALLLAALGIYGMMSYTAAQRTRELGIRAALGAGPGHLRALIVKGGMRLTLVGLAAGLAATLPTTDVIASMLYGVGTTDPLTLAVVAAMLAGVAADACFLPAWRITSGEPLQALRNE
jgi:putative ABC transport system permease protein